MATNFPTSLDNGTSLPNPTSISTQNNPDHAGLHSNENGAIIALETKVGTGSSTPASNQVLFGTGAGTSAWQGLTSAQLASVLSDETGTGSAVFANTPTLITPKVDTINENTLNNGVTVGGVNLKSGAITTSNSVVTANITNASVTANKLATGAVTAQTTTSATTTSTTYTSSLSDAVTTSVTATIGANGLALVCLHCGLANSGNNLFYTSVVLSGANTVSSTDAKAIEGTAATTIQAGTSYLLTGLSAGSTTFTMQYKTAAGTATYFNRTISVVPL